MTDRSTDNPEDPPVPLEPDEAPGVDQTATEDVSAEQEAIAEVAAAAGVNPPEPVAADDGAGTEPAEPAMANELADAAEPNELADTSESPGAEELEAPGGEEAADLDAEELEAAAAAAEADEGAEDQVDEEVEEVEDVDRRPVPAGAAPRGAAKAPTSARAGGRTALEVDPALRIRDRASQVFVALTVIVFVAIFANAMLFGVGGALNAVPSPSPSGSAAPSGSPAPSGSSASSTSPAPTTTTAPSAS